MSNTTMTVTFKAPARIYAALATKTNRSAWLRDAVEEKLAREPRCKALRPATPLGAKLLAARQEHAKAGRSFLSMDEVMAEVAKRRGER